MEEEEEDLPPSSGFKVDKEHQRGRFSFVKGSNNGRWRLMDVRDSGGVFFTRGITAIEKNMTGDGSIGPTGFNGRMNEAGDDNIKT